MIVFILYIILYIILIIHSFIRSCDLDEWTNEQLEIMKIGGNANAKSFFKKHGLTDAQMMVR